MLLRRYSSFLHISLVLTWNMILFEAKYHFRKAIFIGSIFLWNVFLFWVIWFTYSSDKMSTLDTIVKDYDKNIVLRTVKGKLLNIYAFWDYFWDVNRDREPARTDNSVWEIAVTWWGYLRIFINTKVYRTLLVKKVKNKYCKAQDGNWCWSFM